MIILSLNIDDLKYIIWGLSSFLEGVWIHRLLPVYYDHWYLDYKGILLVLPHPTPASAAELVP